MCSANQYVLRDLRHGIAEGWPQAWIQSWYEIRTQSWTIEVRYNAITSVIIDQITPEDIAEDFLCDDLLPAIKWLRQGGQTTTVSYKTAKDTTRHLNETKKLIQEIQ